jgi:putative membrane protein
MMRILALTRAVVAGAGVLAITACSTKQENVSSRADTTTAGGNVQLNSSDSLAAGIGGGAAVSSSSLGLRGADAAAVDVIVAIDQSEIDAGNLAQNKAQNESVRSYARSLVDDHSRDLDHLRMISANGTGAASAAADSIGSGNMLAEVQTSRAAMIAKLSGATAADFDQLFIESQKSGHQEVLDLLQQLQGRTQNMFLQQHLSQMMATVRAHMARAKELQSVGRKNESPRGAKKGG